MSRRIKGEVIPVHIEYIEPVERLTNEEAEKRKRILKEVQESVSVMSGNTIEVFTNHEQRRGSRANTQIELDKVMSYRRGSFHRLRPEEVFELSE